MKGLTVTAVLVLLFVGIFSVTCLCVMLDAQRRHELNPFIYFNF